MAIAVLTTSARPPPLPAPLRMVGAPPAEVTETGLARTLRLTVVMPSRISQYHWTMRYFRRARIMAAEQDTSVSALVRSFLTDLAQGESENSG